MKTKTFALFISMLACGLLTSIATMAQQEKYNKPANQEETVKELVRDNYTYHVFTAPGKTFGYDIFQNKRLVFRLPAIPGFKGDEKVFFTKKEQAEKAAALSIQKLQNGVPPALKPAEVRRIIAE